MASTETQVHPHDVGLPSGVVRKRHRFRYIGYWMITISILTAIPGWAIYGVSIWQALDIRNQPPSRAIFAYALLIISSVTLVLGFWYLLLAHVRRIARMVEDGTAITPAMSDEQVHCPNCGWTCDYPDRFCRHCGKPFGMSIGPRGGPAA